MSQLVCAPFQPLLLLVFTLSTGAASFAVTDAVNPPVVPVSYNRDVRPILSSKCFQCHGFDPATREADLRLDHEEDSRAVIEPGDAAASELIARIESDDADAIMPPPEVEKPLTDRERDILRRWIDQGAQYEAHWVYEPIAPNGSNVSTPSEKSAAIDELLRSHWEGAGLAPVERASPRTLIRRLSLDLRGLPPSSDEVLAFEADPSAERYRAIVDEWIDSLEYAENQAMRWLDLVRFSDTTGLVSDEPMATGLYRRWVVDSFHRNQPFNEFTIEQLAGDLLDDPSDKQFIASAYNRLIKTNCEAGVIDKEALYAMKGEHVRGVGAVWLGATTGCAECHDHKFDPITAKDYYSLAAFFDDLIEVGVYTPGDRRLPIHFVHDSDDARKRDRQLSSELERQLDEISQRSVDDAQLLAWKSDQVKSLGDSTTRDRFVWIDAHDAVAMVHGGEYEMTTREDRPARVTHSDGDMVTHKIAELQTGFFVPKSFLQADPEARLYVDVYLDAKRRPDVLALQLLSGDYGRVGWQPNEFMNFVWGGDGADKLASEKLPAAKKTLRVGEIPSGEGWVRLEIPCQQIDFTYRTVGINFGHIGGSVGRGDGGLDTVRSIATELRLAETLVRLWWDRPHYRMTFQERMVVMRDVILGKAGQDASLQEAWIRLAFQESSSPQSMQSLRHTQAELYRLRQRANTTVVSRAAAPKLTRVLARGNFMDESGDVAQPAIPEFLGKLDTGGRRANRLDLAKWIVSDDNPITARVYVNRAWDHFFGHGISRTLEDSGGQGDWPSHPELLDYLAAEFRESGWDRKSLTRIIVMSDAYQLSSKPSPSLAAADPENEGFARQSRYRLRGEQLRDAVLVAAGLYRATGEIPDESFFPYQPDDYWDRSCKVMYGSRHLVWETSPRERQHQRTLYAFWKRQNIHPMLLAFDAPTRQECTAERMQTNTPGQALAMLNDPIFVDAAIGLADRTLASEPTSDAIGERTRRMFQFALQRVPTEAETVTLGQLISSQYTYYESHPDEAGQLLAQGSSSPGAAESNRDRAAWTMAARALLNTHEFMTRN